MKLIGSLTSPFVRKIHIMLLEQGQPFDFVLEQPWHRETQITLFNPLGKVPALITDEGEVFYDSPIIAAYLDLLGNKPAFVPAEPMEALRMRQVEALADGTLEAAVAIFYEISKRAPPQQSPEWIARQEDKLLHGLAALEAHAKQGVYLNGAALSLGDIATVVFLAWLDFRLTQYQYWRQNFPTLADLTDRLGKRPSFVQTQPRDA